MLNQEIKTKSENLTSEATEMLAEVTRPGSCLKMAFYGQHKRQLHSLGSEILGGKAALCVLQSKSLKS